MTGTGVVEGATTGEVVGSCVGSVVGLGVLGGQVEHDDGHEGEGSSGVVSQGAHGVHAGVVGTGVVGTGVGDSVVAWAAALTPTVSATMTPRALIPWTRRVVLFRTTSP
jgi:hypothetical protein